MQKIFFIEQEGEELNPIMAYLADVARCAGFCSVMEAIKADGPPDLILLAADGDPENLKRDLTYLRGNSFYAKIPRMVFLPAKVPSASLKSSRLESETVLRLPVDKSEVLSKIAGIQKRAHRRLYEILIGVQPEGDGRKYFGKSLDFSETGIAFECNEKIAEGRRVIITFVAPKTRRRFILEGAVVRMTTDHPGALYAYGATFRNMTAEDKSDLMDFITGNVRAKTEGRDEG